MAKAATISTLTIGKRGNVVSFHPVSLPASVVVAGNYGARKAATISTLTIGKRANVPAVFFTLLDTVISGGNCPPAPQVPTSGQRYPGYYTFS